MSASDLYLSSDQQDLLMAALNSNQPSTLKNGSSRRSQGQDSLSFTPGSLSEQTAPGSGRLDFSDESPFLDFNVDGELDDSFHYDGAEQMIGDLPDDDDQTTDSLHEKRKSIDGRDEDDEGGGKRREGDDKTAKKPGRKPLTSEPTTKRKAQNRAAQRAFRERKERHLKDLETKVEELEKTSEAKNHENGLLKAQVEKLQIELREYRKRLSWMANGPNRTQSNTSQNARNSLSGSDFSFEFPKFGDLPSANFNSAANNNNSVPVKNGTQSSKNRTSSSAGVAQPPATQPLVSGIQPQSGSNRNSPANNNLTASPPSMQQGGMDSLSGLFSPSILQATRNSTGYFPEQVANPPAIQQPNADNSYGSVPGLTSNSSISDSPASSADSHQHISSNGTSPQTLFNSPSSKHDYNLTSFGDGGGIPHTFGMQDFSGAFDSLAQQNGGSFDPVLFGDYRETQDNILSQDFGSFFNEAYPLPDLGSPMHNYDNVSEAAANQATKNNLIKRVDAAKDGEEVVPAEKSRMLTCNKIWDRLQSMEKFRNGEIDIDNLCSELRSKAKCSEGGAVVEEKHVNKILGGMP